MKKFSFLLILSAILFQGCSAMMALNGEKEPNFEVVRVGQSKAIVESQALKPIRVESLENGNMLSTYQYTIGDEASAGRAAIYILLDCATCWLSELITMPIEAAKTGEVRFIQIEYSPTGEIVKIG